MKVANVFALPLAIFADRLPGSSTLKGTVTTDVLLQSDTLCDFNNIIVANYPGLTSDDLYALPRSSSLAVRFSQAPLKALGSRVFGQESDDLAALVSQKCSRPVVATMEEAAESVVSIILPGLESEHRSTRKEEVTAAVDTIQTEMELLAPKSTSVIIIAGRPSSPRHTLLHKREAYFDVESPFFFQRSSESNNGTVLHRKGLLHEYQLLTPGLLLTTLVSILILFPILWFGIQTLSSIETPSGIGNIAKTERKA